MRLNGADYRVIILTLDKSWPENSQKIRWLWLLIVLICRTGNAQEWCSPGAVWHRDHDHYLQGDLLIEIRYSKDTMIASLMG